MLSDLIKAAHPRGVGVRRVGSLSSNHLLGHDLYG